MIIHEPKFIYFSIIVTFFAIGGSLYGCPQYDVYHQRLQGEAELAKSQYSRQVQIQDAESKLIAAASLAKAEVERAKGVAEANRIIGQSLNGNEVMSDERNLELDKKIAFLHGWYWDDHRAVSPRESKNTRTDSTGDKWWWLPRYSSDISDAWEVVNFLHSNFGIYLNITMYNLRNGMGTTWKNNQGYKVTLGTGIDGPPYTESSNDLPLAICLVALKATQFLHNNNK